jgi:acetyl esterase/lipase
MSEDILSLAPQPADRRVRYGDDPNQFFDAWLPEESSAVAMVIHGGFWRAKYDLLHTSHMCSALARSGLSVANLEYRRVGNEGGGWPGSYQDVRSGLTAVRREFGMEKKVIVIGHSSGGHLALRLAADEPQLGGVIALAPVAVLRTAYELKLSDGAVADFLGGAPDDIPEIYEAACASRHASTVQRILLHGSHDDVVPLSMSREFDIARQHDPGTVWFMKLDECDHYDLIDPESRAWPIVHMDAESLLEE